MDFGKALQLLKEGKKLTRNSWNGKGLVFVVYRKGYPEGIPCNKETAEAWNLREGELFKCNPYLQIRYANGYYSVYTPNLDDILGEDWTCIECLNLEFQEEK